MSKYHINPSSGKVGYCRAKTNCPFGDLETDHYSSAELARQAFEKKNSTDVVILSKKKAIDPNMEIVATVAAGEALRQHVGLDRLATLLQGYDYVAKNPIPRDEITVDWIEKLGGIVEPDNFGKLRTTPITFSSLLPGESAAPDRVKDSLESLISYGQGLLNEEWLREFLWIHPFSDGNGRTGWIIQNMVEGTLEKPKTLWKLF